MNTSRYEHPPHQETFPFQEKTTLDLTLKPREDENTLLHGESNWWSFKKGGNSKHVKEQESQAQKVYQGVNTG